MAAFSSYPVTNVTLIERVRNLGDAGSWQEFHDTYASLIYNFAMKRGVAEDDAPDIVQTTLAAVAESIHNFHYDPQRSSFKTWLMAVTRHRICDHVRKNPPGRAARRPPPTANGNTATVERIPDPAGIGLEAAWDEEWKNNVMKLALERLKTLARPKHVQIFHLHVIKQQPAGKVARMLGVMTAQVYLVKHRLLGPFEKAVAQLQQELDGRPNAPGKPE